LTVADASEGIKARPPLGEDDTVRIPASPLPSQPQPKKAINDTDALLRLRIGTMERIMVGLLLVLAFFLGSFAATNSGLLLHLAAGRLLTSGEYQFGVDPFSWATPGQYWANASWLYDLFIYAVYSNLGGTALVVCKALVLVLLTGALLRMKKQGEKWWLWIVCVAVALLAMSTRLLLEPFLFSLLFLTLTVSLLFREAPGPAQVPATKAGGPWRPSSLWLLPLLFALWANFDVWFLLGPLTVALALLGELIQRFIQVKKVPTGSYQARRLRTLALVLPVGLLACLANPHLHRVFVLPPELAQLIVEGPRLLSESMPAWMLSSATTLNEIGRYDPLALGGPRGLSGSLWLSPLDADYWSSSGRVWSVSGLAYFPLLALGLGSFVLTAVMSPRQGETGWSWPRLLVWLVFALLSGVLARTIPLFAVVAGPITALNLQAFARQKFGASRRTIPPQWALGGRALTLVGCLALVVLAWFGLLHVRSKDPWLSRHVAWEVRPNPLLRQAAEQLGRMHDTNKLGRLFNYTFEIAPYCAWYAPQVKCCFDFRFELFGSVAADIGRIRQTLRDRPNPTPRARVLFGRHGIDHVGITGQLDQDRAADKVVSRLLAEPGRWPHLFGNAQANIFGWNSPGESRVAFQELAVTPAALVFGRRSPEPALPEGPGPFLEEARPWRDLLLGPASPSGDFEQTYYYLTCFNFLTGLNQAVSVALLHEPGGSLRQVPGWAYGMGLALSSAGPAAAPLTLGSVGWVEGDIEALRERRMEPGPAAQVLLAVQAARRAVAAHPTDPNAYRALADAYLHLWRKQEQALTRRFGENEGKLRQMFRRLQWTAAVKQYLKLDPDNHLYHRALADLYQYDLHFLDVALEHLSTAQNLLEKLKDASGKGPDQKKLGNQAERLRQLNEEVTRRRADFDVRSLGQPMPKKVLIALREPYHSTNEKNQEVRDLRGLGLARQALKLLQDTTAESVPDNEFVFRATFELQLLLDLGEVSQLSATLDDSRLDKGPMAGIYLPVKMCLAAVRGDYAQLDDILAKLEAPMAKNFKLQRVGLATQLVAQLFFDTRLAVQPLIPICNHASLQAEGAPKLVTLAELVFLRGLMALEHGDSAAALRHFNKVQSLIGDWAFYPDRPILNRYKRLLDENQR
jgi:hypothetical protein